MEWKVRYTKPKGECHVNEKFFKMDVDKQNRILNAAIDEFAVYGYDRASTNNIVKNAGISKGLLFHYFGNKKELYRFLYDYTMTYTIDQFDGVIDLEEPDLLLSLKNTVIIKVVIMKKFPNLFDFILSCYLDTAQTAKELDIMNDKRAIEMRDTIYNNADFSMFREDIELSKILLTIEGTLEKISMNEIKKMQMTREEMNLDKINDEIMDYIKMFRQLFYKPEYV